MLYAFKEIVINPEKPVKQAGHIQQVDPISEVHDDLHARILGLCDNKKFFIHVSMDLLGISISFTRKLKEALEGFFPGELGLTVSCTHTHYAGDSTNETYYSQLYSQVLPAIKTLKFTEVPAIYTSFVSTPFEELGCSRISHHKANVILGLISFYDDKKKIGELIYHNVHPTVLSAAETHFFSAEWPGYVLSCLNKQNASEFHSILVGAAGDISTRFTRDGQNYAALEKLGNKLVAKIEELRKNPGEKKLLALDFDERVVKFEHEFNEINFDEIPDYVSARELETIGYGKIMRQRLRDNPERLVKEVLISKVSLGACNLVFSPNELFSAYISYVDQTHSLLVTYSNGYSPYVTPIDEKLLTYETFTDTLTRESKQRIIDAISDFGK